jgi:hypothetical protein
VLARADAIADLRSNGSLSGSWVGRGTDHSGSSHSKTQPGAGTPAATPGARQKDDGKQQQKQKPREP